VLSEQKNPPLSTIFKIFRLAWPKNSDVNKNYDTFGKSPLQQFTEKDPHLASNDFDAIFFRKQNADIHLMGVHGFTKDDLYNLGR
jgi:hypothetical protein